VWFVGHNQRFESSKDGLIIENDGLCDCKNQTYESKGTLESKGTFKTDWFSVTTHNNISK